MGNISYYSWGSYYYDSHTSYYSYYKVTNVITSAPSTISYNVSATLYVKPVIDGYNGKADRINVKSNNAGLTIQNSLNYTALLSPSSPVGSTFSFNLKNNNNSYSDKTATLTITAYTEKNKYKTVTRSIICNGNPNIPVDTSYYTYNETSYTYYNSNNNCIYTYYYNINALDASWSKSGVLTYYDNVKLTPFVELSHSAAKVDKVEYRVNYPYYLSLSNSSLLVAGKTSNLGTVTLYNFNNTTNSASANVSITAYCGPVYRSISKSIIVAPKPQLNKPQILSHSLSGNAYIAFNGNTNIVSTLTLKNDYVVSNVSYLSTTSSVAYYVPATFSSSTLKNWGNSMSALTIGIVNTHPEISHSGATVSVVNTIKTYHGLTSTRYMDVKINETDMSYYNTYFAPSIEYAYISRSTSNVSYNGNVSFTLYYSLKNDNVSSISWSTNSVHVSLSSSGNKATLFANNQTNLQQSATISVKLTTKSGLVRLINSPIIIDAAPVVEPEDPEIPKLNIDEARTNIIAYVNSQFDLLNA